MAGTENKQTKNQCAVESVLNSKEKRLCLLDGETLIDSSSSVGQLGREAEKHR
jgi:hypothetical protein